MKTTPLSLLVLLALSTTPLRADHPAVPDGAATEGSNGGTFGGATTVQQLCAAADLTGLNAGDTITGISFRLDTGSGAFATTSFSRFDIRMGPGKASLTTDFASNFAGPATAVRTGTLALAAGTFPSGTTPNSFGAVIPFDTPYVYGGGNLLIEMRKSAPSVTFDVDGHADTDGTAGEYTFATGADATTGVGVFPFNLTIAFEVTRAGSTPERIAIPDGAAAEGNNTGNFIQAGGMTGQMRYLPAQLGSLRPGDTITGIGFRLDDSVTNFHSTTFSRFDIRMGRASAGYSTASGTAFAANFASAPRLVRSGPMTLFLAGISGNPNPFATRPIHFATPHTYTGGALLFETRTSPQTTSLFIDATFVTGYGGGLFKQNTPEALTGDVPAPDGNWMMELHVRRDKTAPKITFSGKPKLKGGRARVKGTVIEAGTVATITFRSSASKRGRRAQVSSAVHFFSFNVRSRVKGTPVAVTITATDASGNQASATREYRP